MHRLIIAFSLAFMTTFLPGGIHAQSCDSLSAEVTAEVSYDPGYEGLYKYTITAYWEVSGVEQGWGLSHIIFSLGPECPCICDETTDQLLFPEPAGTSTGIDNDTEEPCEVLFPGFLECTGMEDITTDAILKFEIADNQSCEPVHYGNGTWVFYSTMPPLTWAEYPGSMMIKYGEMLCWNGLSGRLPDCHHCVPTSSDERSWGQIKAIHR